MTTYTYILTLVSLQRFTTTHFVTMATPMTVIMHLEQSYMFTEDI